MKIQLNFNVLNIDIMNAMEIGQSDLKVSTCVSVCFSTSRNLRYQLKFFLGLIEFEMIEV